MMTGLSTRPIAPSQPEFAFRFGVALGSVRDPEQGRVNAPKAMKVLVAAIELDPFLVEKAAVLAAERSRQSYRDSAALTQSRARARNPKIKDRLSWSALEVPYGDPVRRPPKTSDSLTVQQQVFIGGMSA